MKKIKAEYVGIFHINVVCFGCDFVDELSVGSKREREKLLTVARKHVRKTGHKMSIEKCSATKYTLESA